MTLARSVPPGRAGQLWLERRLRTARRGAGLLDRKLRILLSERERVALREAHAREEWEAGGRAAQAWVRRGSVVAGRQGLRPTAAGGPATVTVVWHDVMGVRYPREAGCSSPPPGPEAASPGSAALVLAGEACRGALAAAARQAAATAALRLIDAEIETVRRRLHAIEDRWIPRLEAEAAVLRVGLEESERADGVRLRWALAAGDHDAGSSHERPVAGGPASEGRPP